MDIRNVLQGWIGDCIVHGDDEGGKEVREQLYQNIAVRSMYTDILVLYNYYFAAPIVVSNF